MILSGWRENWIFIFISVSLHIIAFIFLGMFVLSSMPEPLDSIDVQLMKAPNQAQKLRRLSPITRKQAIIQADVPERIQNTVKPLDQRDISHQVSTEINPVFHYEAVMIDTFVQRADVKCADIQRANIQRAAWRVKQSRSVPRSLNRLPTTDNRQPLLKLSLTYSPSSVSIHSVSDSALIRDFLQIISKKIEKSKRYPEWAAEAGLEGKVVVRFTVLRDGTLGEDLYLVKSSGTEALDNAAIAAIREAAPFPELPRSLHRDRLQIELPMNFKLFS